MSLTHRLYELDLLIDWGSVSSFRGWDTGALSQTGSRGSPLSSSARSSALSVRMMRSQLPIAATIGITSDELHRDRSVCMADFLDHEAGLPDLNLVAYDGDFSWLGWPVISGHWFSAPGEVDVNTEFLTEIGLRVGDRFTLTVRGRPVPVRIAGQVYDPNGPSLYTSWQTLGGTAAGIRATFYAIELRPRTTWRR